MKEGLGQLGLHISDKLVIGPDHGPALVGGHQVENAEERLACLLVPPMGSCTGFIPACLDNSLIVAAVIVGLDVVTRIITDLAKEAGESGHVVRDREGGPHLLCALGCGIEAIDDAGAGGRADGRAGKSIGIKYALVCKLVYIRRISELVAVATERGAHILGGDPEDVWALGRENH